MRLHLHLSDLPFPADALSIAEAAESLGWECVWVPERHLTPGSVPNPAVLLAAMAARTGTLRLGSEVAILPLRHPFQVAEDYALLDALCAGRLEFGMGMGMVPAEFDALGLERAEIFDRFDEASRIVQLAWAGTRFSHDGPIWPVTEATCVPAPARTPPLWVKGAARGSLTWAGSNGHNLIVDAARSSPEAFGKGLTAWVEGLARAGLKRTDRLVKLNLRVWVDEDGEAALEAARAAGAKEDLLLSGRVLAGDPESCAIRLGDLLRAYPVDVISTCFDWLGQTTSAQLTAMRWFAAAISQVRHN
ncbi:LLM class flavin-dependent oxidoreductase [Rhizohabitans arisaemae]|uniref:LLM class flavin-dependent oxidoreductase n=1 Tax=Rhizohabitans arisaemae TaxID=2720610 RepID=UPI0024B22B18|nr:LLM class flavin-dependent oxidoreductase [Rhizohabitans arisaemae]